MTESRRTLPQVALRAASTLPAQERPRLTQRIPIDFQRSAAACCCR